MTSARFVSGVTFKHELNSSKTKTMIVFWSRTIHAQSLHLTIGGAMLNESYDLEILGVTFYSKMNFEKHLPSVFSDASLSLGILRKF